MPIPVVSAAYGYIGVGKQTAQGTAVAPTDFFLYDKESFKQNIGATFKHTGTSQQIAYSIIGKSAPGGQLTIPLTSNTALRMLAYGMGGTDTVVGTVDPWSHSFGIAADLPWLTIERAIANQSYIERYQDCKINDWTLHGKEADQVWLDFTASAGQSAVQASPATVVFDADAPFMFRSGLFALNGVVSANLLTCAGLSIACKRNVKPHYTTSVAPQYQVPTNREFTVSMDFFWDATNAPVWYNDIVHAGGTSGVTSIPFTGQLVATFDPGATPDHQVVITIPNLNQVNVTAPLNVAGDVQMVTISGTAVMPAGGGSELTITGKNATSLAYI